MTENDLPEQLRIRREKRDSLLARGISPYPVHVPRTASLKEVRERFKDLATDSSTGVIESVTGRIIFKRDTGKLCFATLREGDGTELQVMLSLDKMIQGGIYDHLGGGFSRYSTDAHWQAPHFEKMLYDNALLLAVLSETLPKP